MSYQDGRRATRPYRKASEYLAQKPSPYEGKKSLTSLEQENADLRDKLMASSRKLETMEVEYDQSREYFSTQLEIAREKLNRTTDTLKVMQKSYSELQSVNYELEQRILKVSTLERERAQLGTDVQQLSNRLEQTRMALQKMQQENERLKKDCNLAVSLLECNSASFKPQRVEELPRDLQTRVETFQMDLSQYNEYVNPYADDSDSDEAPHDRPGSDDTVPPELLANVLKKPESISIDMERHNYPPELTVPYKGQIKEKKLVKHDYPAAPEFLKMNQTSSNTNNNQRSHGSSVSSSQSSSPWEPGPTRLPKSASSPWERAPAITSSSSSPWEMSSNQSVAVDDDDDYSAASAYGAYPVSYRNSRPRKKQGPTRYNPPSTHNTGDPTEKKSSYRKTQMSSSYHAAISTRKPSQKGTGENKDVYIAENNVSTEPIDKAPSRSSGSGQSSRKSTPAHNPSSLEKGSSAERSSLLGDEDENEMVLTIKYGREKPGEFGDDEGHELLGNESDFNEKERMQDFITNKLRDYEDDPIESQDHEETEKREIVNPRGSIKHEQQDLLNMEDDVPTEQPVKTFSDDLQGLLCDVTSTSQSTMLPELPPPSETPFSNELILSTVPAPPPPDMFGGAPAGNIPYGYHISPPAYVHPVAYTSDLHHQSYQPIKTPPSGSKPADPLGDLTSVVEKEFEAAQSPKKVVKTPTEQKNLEEVSADKTEPTTDDYPTHAEQTDEITDENVNKNTVNNKNTVTPDEDNVGDASSLHSEHQGEIQSLDVESPNEDMKNEDLEVGIEKLDINAEENMDELSEDLDPSDGSSQRRASFEHAREFGNVMGDL